MTNGKGLAITGLILGLIGAGLGGYVFFDSTIAPLLGLGEPAAESPPVDVPDINSWYVENYSITLPSTGTFLPLSTMVVSFNTSETVTLHLLYTAYVRIQTALGDAVDIRIHLNSTILTTNTYYIDEFGAAAQERFAVNMQNYIPALPPGNYNVTVLASVDHISTFFYMNSLYVQTHT